MNRMVRTLFEWVLFFSFLGFTLAEKKVIDCPKTCPANVYKPICSRGKSYANLCVLKLEICRGNIQNEVYQDIESCPGFNKLEDENGASVEMVDKNGVIFRGLFDKNYIGQSNDEIIPKRKYYRNRLPYRFIRRQQLKRRLCAIPCSSKIPQLPVCVLGEQYANPCTVKSLICKGKLPLAAIAVMEYCEDDSEEMDAADGMSRLDRWLNNFEIPSLRIFPEDNREHDCPQSCDRNEYAPVCAKGRAFQSECQLKRAICKGEVPKELLAEKAPCPKFDKTGGDTGNLDKNDMVRRLFLDKSEK